MTQQLKENSVGSSEDTDSIQEVCAIEPVRMAGDSPKSPSPTHQAGENLAKLREERKSLIEKIQ